MRRQFVQLYMHIHAALTLVWTLECGSKMRAFSNCRNSFVLPKAQRNFCAFFFPPKKAKAKILLNSIFFSPISKIFRGKAISSYTHTYIQEFSLLLCFFHSPFPYSIYIHSLRSLARIHIAGRISLWNKLP